MIEMIDIDFRPKVCEMAFIWNGDSLIPIWAKYSWTGHKATENQTIIKPGFQ